MKISIIIPTYNRFNKLANLLNSLIPQIREQGLEKNIEVLIVDDHSDRVAAERIKHLLDRNEHSFLRLFPLDRNRGPSFARNYGLGQSAGNLIIFLDDDCIVEQNYILETIRAHEEHPEVLVLNGNLKKLRDDFYSNFWFYNYNAVFNKEGSKFYQVNRLASGNFSIKRTLLKIINPLFDESLPSREDYDLYFRLQEKGIGLYKSDDIVAYLDCRDSLVGLIKQRMWYSKGEYYIRRKYGEEFIIADEKKYKTSIRQHSPFLAILLGFSWRLSMKYWKLRDMMKMRNLF
ncbi:MAG: glycosyltransferase family 2 protein [Ignavibacteriales bacterium]